VAEYDFDICIIGGGAAGLTVAAGSAQLGAKTLLVEKEPKLGGDCLHYGCVPSKTLIRSAHVYHLMRNAEKYGLPRVDVPRVDFRQVAARIQGVIDVIQKHDSEERFCSLGAKVVFGEPQFIDEHQIDIAGKRYSAKNFVIATGSSPAAPPINGLEETPYLTNKEIFSLDELPDSLIVMGAGPIAVEMAQAFARLGSQVTVIQRSEQILSKEDPDMAAVVREALEEEGVRVVTGAQSKEAGSESGGKFVIAEVGGEERKFVASEILVALGRKSNNDPLKLENAGVETDKKGYVSVDERMRSSQKHVFGAGDAVGGHQFTHAAGYEGSIVVSNAIFHLPRKADYTWLPWCTYCQPELASIGHNERTAKAAGIDYEVRTEDFQGNDRALAEGEGRGRLKLLLAKGKPVGVQIAGPHAGELIGEWAAVAAGDVGLSKLAGSIHAYPTLAEINKRVAGNYVGEKIFSEKVKKVLGFFFNYKGRACYTGEE
jgi:pyruvate/2-oxoglutarate dehydrogenase complex dihydrolipoamide dehydrogenase (E3) component